MKPAKQRVAIVSSPRSGNTWLRHLLRDGLGLQELAVHNYADVHSVPERCVMQLHWYREPNFQRFLSENGFRVLVLARHPLDVLISVLHFIKYEPETARWLGGNCEIPSTLAGKSPTSEEFVDYAVSFGAENLLSVTYQWWHERTAVRVRFEDLVGNAEEQIRSIAGLLGEPCDDPEEAVRTNSIGMFQALPNRHGWQGRAGLWRELLLPEHASRIFRRHESVFRTLGYGVEPSAVSHDEALATWDVLQR